MKKNRTAIWVGVLIALGVVVYLFRGRIHFDWGTFLEQLKKANWWYFALGILLIYLGYVVRAVRWALFLRPTKRVPHFSLIGSQVIGFTAVAIFGRPADLARPYLVARRTNLSLTPQFAVWAVERMFDLSSMALIFGAILLFAPDRATLPHVELVDHLAVFALFVVAAFILFAFFVRAAGARVAELFGKAFGALSPKIGEGVREKILAFRDGLNAIDSFSALIQASALSLTMWMMIVYSYLFTIRAFTDSPPLPQHDAGPGGGADGRRARRLQRSSCRLSAGSRRSAWSVSSCNPSSARLLSLRWARARCCSL